MNNFEHGGEVSGIKYDFSVNLNPLGMPSSAKKILAESVFLFEKYPDAKSISLRRKLSEREKIHESSIYCSCGADDIIYRTVNAVRPHTALIIAPTFSEYERALESVGCSISYHFLRTENDFMLTEEAVSDAEKFDMIFLCCPNNPTGRLADRNVLMSIIKKCCEANTVPVIDMSFIEFCDGYEKYLDEEIINSGAVIIRAFTKIYAMAGLRAGWCICSDKVLLQRIEKAGQYWGISIPAQLAAEASLEDKDYILRTQELVGKEREYLCDELDKMNIRHIPSDANFILIHTDTDIYDVLISKSLNIRKCGNFRGLDDNYYRIAVRTHEENEYLINILRGIING